MEETQENLSDLENHLNDVKSDIENIASSEIEKKTSFDEKIKKYEETYFSYINSLVKPIDINFNVLEWRLFTELDEHHYIEAYCGFIVRCVKNNHQIASIVSDDHGRVAFNIAFNSIEEYFNEKKKMGR